MQASAVPIGDLASVLESQTASKINGDAVQEDGAFVHAENKYGAEFQGDQPLQLTFQTRNDDGKHFVVNVVKGGIAEQQGVRVGHQLVAFGGKTFGGMTQEEVTREIKESTFTGKLELIRLEEDGGVDLPGAPAAAGDGKHEQRQEPAENPLTEAEEKLLKVAKWGKLQEAKDALDDGARVDAVDEEYPPGTPLHKAADNGHKEMVGMLIERGANVDAAHKDGRTPLHLAALRGHKEIVGMLIGKGANVNAADEDGVAPLHYAAGYGHKEIVGMLIERGAKVDAADKKGKSPLDVSWDEDPSSPVTLLLLWKSKSGIGSMIMRHLTAKLGAQLGKLIKNCDEGNEEDRHWLGTEAKNQFGRGEEGLWVKGGDAVVGLLVRILSEGQSSLVVPLFEKLLVPSTAGYRPMMESVRVAAVDSETKMLTYPAADWPDTHTITCTRSAIPTRSATDASTKVTTTATQCP
jgi:hypothetical protein